MDYRAGSARYLGPKPAFVGPCVAAIGAGPHHHVPPRGILIGSRRDVASEQKRAVVQSLQPGTVDVQLAHRRSLRPGVSAVEAVSERQPAGPTCVRAVPPHTDQMARLGLGHVGKGSVHSRLTEDGYVLAGLAPGRTHRLARDALAWRHRTTGLCERVDALIIQVRHPARTDVQFLDRWPVRIFADTHCIYLILARHANVFRQ